MNRKERRTLQYKQHCFVAALSEKLTQVPPEEFPLGDRLPVMAWRSRKYLVQLYQETNADYPLLLRLSICRVKINGNGDWRDGLTWDELQKIKREVGYGAWYAVEVYPADRDVVNVANFRHLWLLETPLPIGWFK